MGMLPPELWWWRLRRRTEFSNLLVHEVIVPAGPGGRPGERLLATSKSVYGSMYEPRLASDESRDDFRVLVGKRSTLAVVCLGRVSERGEPYESAIRTIARISAWPGMDCAAIADAWVAGDRAVRYRVLRPGACLPSESSHTMAGCSWRASTAGAATTNPPPCDVPAESLPRGDGSRSSNLHT
jgi:hypothetical protein